MTRRASTDPAGVKFQRIVISMVCLGCVLFKTSVPLLFILFTTIPAILFGTEKDGIIVFYRKCLVPILGRELFSFQGKATGLFLLGLEAETFQLTVMTTFISSSLGLSMVGNPFWPLPIAIVCAGMGLAGTSGFCLMGLFYLQMRKLWRHE